MYIKPTDGYVEVNGVRLHYQEWGEPSHPDMLLVHGWSTAAPLWHEVAEELAQNYHIIVPDNRGNGESMLPIDGFRLSDFAEDMIQMIGKLDLFMPVFVGNSWGANIGTYIAAERPDLISAAFLEDPVYWKMIDAFITIVPPIINRRDQHPDKIRAAALARDLSIDRAEREVYLFRHFSPDVLTKVATLNRDWALTCDQFLSRILVPTLVLVADSDAGGYITPEEISHHRSTASNQVRFHVWKGVGHMMHSVHPGRFVNELREFLNQ